MSQIRNRAYWGGLFLALMLASCQRQETIRPVRKNFTDAVFASGYTEPENIYTVSAKAEGLILAFPVREGDTVRRHDVIATIENDVQRNQLRDAQVVYVDAERNAAVESPQLQQLQTQIDQAREQLAFDTENYHRYKTLWEKNSVSRLDFERVELQYQTAQSNLSALREQYAEVRNTLALSAERSLVQVKTQQSLLADYRLITETAGRVIDVFKKQGELVRRGEPVAKIGSGAYLIKLLVAEDDITRVAVGQSVAVHLNTYPEATFPARITKIHPAFDAAEQSYIVEARFEQLPERMFSGTQLQANIATGSRENVLVIPTAYLARGRFVTLDNGTEKRIETGTQNGTWTEVVAGLSEEDIIVKPQP